MIAFSGNPLDRAAEKRAEPAWLATRLAERETRIVPVWRGQILAEGEPPHARFLAPADVEGLAGPDAACVFLGMDGARAHFALEVSATENPNDAWKATFGELRAAAAILPAADLAILGQAKAMIDWHHRHGFCARCGAKTNLADAGYKRVCAACNAEHFPRTDPVVIMLALQGDECLLGRGPSWPPGRYSALAGYMEPGETIEEAVRRELFEEAGVVAGAVRYVASQPWPFPSQLMIGCFAQAQSRALRIDEHELADARWVSREDARAMLRGEVDGLRAPPEFAIAHQLIKRWVDN